MPVEFVLVRIDDRLIHGQVVVGWAKALAPDLLIVANDVVVHDSLQKSLMEMAATSAFAVKICGVEETAAWHQQRKFDGKRVLLLFSSPADVLRAIKAGLKVEKVNVGGMRYSPGKKQIRQAIDIDHEDAVDFKQILDQGIQVSIQMVPTDEPLNISKYL